VTPPAAGEDAIVGDFSGELRDVKRALRVEVGAVLGDGVRERDEDSDGRLRSCFCSLDKWKCSFSLHLA
jgi:hypothetical protein